MLAIMGLALLTGASLRAQRVSNASKEAAAALYNRLFDAYEAGDRDIVRTQLTTMADCTRISPALESSTKALLDSRPAAGDAAGWRRDKAAFVLELANVLSACAPDGLLTLLSEGRTYVMRRPTALGEDAGDDAFELTWHLIAVAILQREDGVEIEDVYLDTLERRYATSQDARAAQSVLDPRFEVMRAVAAEQRAVQRVRAPRTSNTAWLESARTGDLGAQPSLPQVTPPPGSGWIRPTAAPGFLKDAAKVLERTATVENVAAESWVRLSAIRFQLGQLNEALAASERAQAPSGDPGLAYWALLWRGRILDALGRVAEAEAAYQGALEAWPAGQAAGVGLALTRFKQNRRAEAAQAAALVQAMPPGAPDPWWFYRSPHTRFMGAWFSQLRAMLP